MHHHAGLAVSGSGSYIDSVILRDRDTTGDGTLDERLYYLQNWRSDVVALITDTGDQREQVRYEPYGTPFGLPAGDIDSDGDFDATDYAGITGAYDVRKDVNMDGSITFADTTAAYNINGLHTMGRGVASSDAVTNRKGYAGYEHLAELAGAKWDVRNRILISELGTWNRRDPLGYVDGMNLYAYVMLMPIVVTDEMGETLAVPCCSQGATPTYISTGVAAEHPWPACTAREDDRWRKRRYPRCFAWALSRLGQSTLYQASTPACRLKAVQDAADCCSRACDPVTGDPTYRTEDGCLAHAFWVLRDCTPLITVPTYSSCMSACLAGTWGRCAGPCSGVGVSAVIAAYMECVRAAMLKGPAKNPLLAVAGCLALLPVPCATCLVGDYLGCHKGCAQ